MQSFPSLYYIFVISVFFAVFARAQITLESYNIDADAVSVSGLSAGGAMATQYHVAHSESIMGVSLFAGVVYNCAQALLSTALLCMSTPGLTNVNALIDDAYNKADRDEIDPVFGMAGDKVFIYTGSLDSTVLPNNAGNIQEFYEQFTSTDDIAMETDVRGEHGQPHEYYGAACEYNGGEYINDCDYYGAFVALNHTYGNLLKPSSSFIADGILQEFDQTEFIDAGNGMDDVGYIYVPTNCNSGEIECRLHISFHGCQQQREEQGDTYSMKTGYIEIGELNNIIMVFPQAKSILLSNPNGCFDWWGYSALLSYAERNGPQIKAVKSIIDRLIG